MVTHNAEDDEKAQKAFLFLCLVAKDWGTFSNHARTCEHTHTAQKHISPFTVRSQASTYPSIEKHRSSKTQILIISAHYLPLSALPFRCPSLFIYGSKEGQREKNRQKSEVSPATIINFDNYTLQNKQKILFYLRKGCGILHPNSLLGPQFLFMAKTAQKGIERLGEFHVDEALL